MLDIETKRRIDTARDILVGKIPDPKSQIEQITIALIYKFMDDMDKKSEELGGKSKFFTGNYSKYAWNKILDQSVSGFELVALYGEAIQSMNQNPNLPQLFRDIFKNAYLPYRDPETLRAFLRIIDDFKYDHSERLGDAFEYLLSVMGSQGDAGQFRTPRHIIDFIVKVVNPSKKDTILDPACGTAGFLISAYKHIVEKNMKDGKLDLTPDERKKLVENIVGYDISPDMVRLSLVNLYLHGFKNPHISEYDTLTSDEKWNETFDVCLANPPFMTPKGGIRPHKRFSVDSNRAEVLFVDYMAEHLTNDGKAGIVVPEGIIFQSGTTYKQLRKMLVDNALYAVVSLPAGVFNPYSGVKTSILFLDKRIAKKTKDVLFVKAESDGFGLGAQRREVKDNDLTEALTILQEYQKAILDGIEPNVQSKIAHIVSKDKIGKSGDYNLSGDRYKENKIYAHKDFEMVELGEVCEVIKGSMITKEIVIEGNIPVIAGGQNPAYYHNQANRDGNIITVSASGAYAGFVNYFTTSIFASDCTTIQSKNEAKLMTKYVYHLLKGRQEDIYKFQRGGGQPHVYPKDLIPMKIPLPPLEVQERIVEEIENYQNIIDGAKKVVDSYKPTIIINSDWEMKLFGEICVNLDSKRKPVEKSVRKSGIYPYYGASGIVDYVDEFLFDGSYLLVSEDGANLRARVTPIAFSVNGKIWVNNHAHILEFKNQETQTFVEIYLNSIDLNIYITGSAQPKLNQESLNSIKIPLPPLEIQKQIVSKIEEEQSLVNSNKKLIELFEKKIKDKIAEVWGE